MADVKMCERCGEYYIPSKDKVYKYVQVTKDNDKVEEFPTNAIRIGYWTRKNKWKNIASANDICNNCMRKICDVVFGDGSKIVMKSVDDMKRLEKVKNKPGVYKKVKEEAVNPIEKDQQEFAEQKVAEDDGE